MTVTKSSTFARRINSEDTAHLQNVLFYGEAMPNNENCSLPGRAPARITCEVPVIRVGVAVATMESASNDLPFRCQIEIAIPSGIVHYSRRESFANEPSFRNFFRARFRAQACFTRRFSPGFK